VQNAKRGRGGLGEVLSGASVPVDVECSHKGVRAMPKAKQLSVWVESRPGMLGEVASALGTKKVNIIGLMAPAAEGRGAIRLVVDKPVAAKKALAEGGWETTEEDIIQVTLADKPGALGSAASKLGAVGINIHYAYTGSAKGAQKVSTFFAVADVVAALKALR